MVQKQAKKEAKLLPAVMKEYDAVFSLSLSEGFANISFDEKGNIFVKFLNDEGYATEDAEQNLADVQKVARFMEEMKTLRLQDYSRPNA
jgi:hypothetical protein